MMRFFTILLAAAAGLGGANVCRADHDDDCRRSLRRERKWHEERLEAEEELHEAMLKAEKRHREAILKAEEREREQWLKAWKKAREAEEEFWEDQAKWAKRGYCYYPQPFHDKSRRYEDDSSWPLRYEELPPPLPYPNWYDGE